MNHELLLRTLIAIEVVNGLPYTTNSHNYGITQVYMQRSIPKYFETMSAIRLRLDNDCMYKTHQALEWLSIFGELNDT